MHFLSNRKLCTFCKIEKCAHCKPRYVGELFIKFKKEKNYNVEWIFSCDSEKKFYFQVFNLMIGETGDHAAKLNLLESFLSNLKGRNIIILN